MKKGTQTNSTTDMLSGSARYWANMVTPFLIISPGTPMYEMLDIKVASTLRPTAIHGIRRPPRKNSLVLACRLEDQITIPIVTNR